MDKPRSQSTRKVSNMKLAPFKIRSSRPLPNAKVWIVNVETGTTGPRLSDTAENRAALRKTQARLNSSIALDRLGIY